MYLSANKSVFTAKWERWDVFFLSLLARITREQFSFLSCCCIYSMFFIFRSGNWSWRSQIFFSAMWMHYGNFLATWNVFKYCSLWWNYAICHQISRAILNNFTLNNYRNWRTAIKKTSLNRWWNHTCIRRSFQVIATSKGWWVNIFMAWYC